MSTSSVSKGCFLFNASSRRKQRVLDLSSFEQLPGETEAQVQLREEAFTRCWTTVKKKIDDIVTTQHDRVFADLLRFMHTAHDRLTSLHETSRGVGGARRRCEGEMVRGERDDEASGQPSAGEGVGFLPPRLEVPTAALIAGVNMPDHEVLFGRLKLQLQEQITPHVVQLSSKDCNSGMKATMKEIMKQLIQQSVSITDSDDEAAPGGSSKPPTKRVPLPSMAALCGWYREDGSASPSSLELRRPPVVVVIEDFEGFVPQVLQDLIISLSPHLPEFPVVLVLGLATSVGTIHHTLSRSASSLLSIEQFQVQHSALTLSQVIREVLMTSLLPFKLGPRTYRFLLQQFFCTTFSLTSFSRGLQCAMMEHFYWQPLSVLCMEKPSDQFDEIIEQLSHPQCEMVRATASFQCYVGKVPPERQLKLLEDDSELKAEVQQLISAMDHYHHCFFPLLLCLFHLTELLPNAPLGSQLHELYGLCIEHELESHLPFSSTWTMLRVMGRSELVCGLSKAIVVLEDAVSKPNCPSVSTEALSALRRFAEELESLDHLPMETNSEDGSGEATSAAAPVGEGTTSERKMKFQERLRQLAARKKEPSEYEKILARLLDYLHNLFMTYLQPPKTQPLHELFYFDQISSLKKHLGPAPRVSIQTALSRPDYYLPSVSSVTEHSGLDANMPDICIAYQLHLECGRLINLYDWLQAFISVVQPGVADSLRGREEEGEEEEEEERRPRGRKKVKCSKEEVDPLVQARFIQAVSELQFLGFIKPTQRKTDHVQRLTWGAC